MKDPILSLRHTMLAVAIAALAWHDRANTPASKTILLTAGITLVAVSASDLLGFGDHGWRHVLGGSSLLANLKRLVSEAMATHAIADRSPRPRAVFARMHRQ